MDHSLIEFKYIDNKTVLTQQYSAKPLKIINPKASLNSCFCMLTNYGGGFVQGDVINLDIKCGENTNSIVSSQANTRIYESTGVQCSQTITTEVEKNAFHVFINDPLVLHKGGAFSQKTNYKLKTDAVVLFVDWFVAGRTENGEAFDFKEYLSDTEITLNDTPVLRDRFHLVPEEMDIQSPALFNDNVSFINVFLAGNQDLERVEILENGLNQIFETISGDGKIKSTVDRINNHSYVGRFTSSDVLKLRGVVEKISEILEDKRLLKFNPLARKY